MTPAIVAPAVLVFFTLLFYRELGPGGRILLSFDPIGYFVPSLTYLGQSLREGRLPLWDPYLFGGAPFLANSQTGVFYPPNWLAAVLPAPQVYAWLIVGHALFGALGAYAFARRSLGLGSLGALAAALVFAFGGWPSGQAGHLNQFQALAWLPYILLIFDRLLRVPAIRPAVLGGVLLALQVFVGHTQTVYLSAWVLALYAGWVVLGRFFDAWRSGERLPSLACWTASRVVPFGVLGLVAFGLSAPQLLTTLELSDRSIRAGGLDYGLAASFSFQPFRVLQGLLPTYAEATINSEWIGYVGVTGLLLVGTALALRPNRRVVGMLLVCGLALGFALGQFNPLYPFAYRHIPGIGLFRVPARWLFVFTVALAGLAGTGLDALAAKRPSRPSDKSASWRQARRVSLVLFGLLAGLGLLLALYQRVVPAYPLLVPGATTLEIWAATALVGLALVLACLRWSEPRPAWLRGTASSLLLALLAAELLAASLTLDLNRTGPLLVATETTPEIDFLQAGARSAPDAPFRILGVSGKEYDLAGQAGIAASLSRTLSPDEVESYLAAIRHKQTETPNVPLAFGLATLDGYDGGVLPLQRYVDLKSLFPTEGNNVVDGRLWVQVLTAPHPRLLGWLNVRYLIMDRSGDLRLAGADYDLAMPRPVEPSRPIALAGFGSVEATEIGLISHLEDVSPSAGAEVAVVTVETADGRSLRLPLRAGAETAPGKPTPGETALSAVAPGLRDPDVREYLARFALPVGTRPTRITVEYLGGTGRLVVRALSLVGATPEASRIVDLSPDYRLAYLGDTKIYENLAVLPRAYVVGRIIPAADDPSALAALGSPDFDARAAAVVTASELAKVGGGAPAGRSGEAAIAEYSPERVVLETDQAAPGLLVLTDAAYPGWRAFVDGVEKPILTTNYLFRGVWLEAGAHRIEFRFEPDSLRVGLLIAGFTALLALGLAFVPPRAAAK